MVDQTGPGQLAAGEPSPRPQRIFETRPIRWLLEHDTVVICAGGGGIPTKYNAERQLVGVEAVIDKDFASELLARELAADRFRMATDVDAAYLGWGTSHQRAIRVSTPRAMRAHHFPAGSMGPKVDAACQFASATGKPAVIGALTDLTKLLNGTAGTTIRTDTVGMTGYDPE